jgi:ribonuclease D
MKIVLHHNDLEHDMDFGSVVAVDTEALGLNPHRDRLCVVQLSSGDGVCHLVKFDGSSYEAPRLKRILNDKRVTKIFHFGRFDVAILSKYLGVDCSPLYCTKISSKLTRTYTDRHSLKDLCSALLGIELSKQEQTSDWGADTLTESQKIYAATDVLHLHALKEKLDAMLEREGRTELAQKCFEFLPTCADLDLKGWNVEMLFSHK